MTKKKKRETPWLVGKPSNNSKTVVKSAYLMIRTSEAEKLRYEAAAASKNQKTSVWARETLDAQADEDLENN